MYSSTITIGNRFSPARLKEITRVLVIDDDVETTELMQIILDPKLFEVYSTNSGLEGLELVRQLDPNVVVVDLLMPEMDGLTLCKEIRKFSRVPILVLSAINKPGIAAQALEIGADDYLNKPMTNSLLAAHLNTLVRRARLTQQEADIGAGIEANNGLDVTKKPGEKNFSTHDDPD